MDLIEISPNAQPPVCRITNYGKYKYDLEKKGKATRKHHGAGRIKEVQFHPNVGDHDYQTKIRHILEFLDEGHRVKIGLFFRGREMAHQDIGFEVVNRILRDTQEWATPEQAPKILGRAIFMLLSPKQSTRARPPAAGAKPLPAPAANPPAP